jgi:hypothetical protein
MGRFGPNFGGLLPVCNTPKRGHAELGAMPLCGLRLLPPSGRWKCRPRREGRAAGAGLPKARLGQWPNSQPDFGRAG